MNLSKNFRYSAHRLSIVSLFIIISSCLFAQDCPIEAVGAKYWQYRQNLNKHFVLNDIDSSGCVGDGIGLSKEVDCFFTKSGYGIPATSIVMESNGGAGMYDRNDTAQIQWYDAGCAQGGPDGGTSFNPNEPRKFNYIEYGSETPHQMGQYWGVLATEYALLKQNHQDVAAQRTLNQLFLGLQAYRRLDMQAQCLVHKRYEEIRNNFEIEYLSVIGPDSSVSIAPPYLCGLKYIAGRHHDNFIISCDAKCEFTPDLSGYSGLFLREDATQNQEILHDSLESRWNIDLVSSVHAMSISPPCTTSFSQTCYNVRWQNFMSQDGIFGLMIGLTLIKKYIPDTAKVVTCDSTIYHPLEMAIRIATSITDKIDNEYRNWVIWPGSRDCCNRRVYFTDDEGGSLKFTMHMLKKVANYMDGGTRHSNADEWFHWGLLTQLTTKTYNSNGKFWLRLMALGVDLGTISPKLQNFFKDRADYHGLEILGLINDLLYPGNGGIYNQTQEYFEEMLCSAPCSGPCVKQDPYGSPGQVLPDFPCSNALDWRGQRWESGSVNPDQARNRLYNGLDYMLLHNVYMLHFPTVPMTPFENPEYTEYNDLRPSVGNNYIIGSSTLCKGETGLYQIEPTSPGGVLTNIKWGSTPNLTIDSETSTQTDVTLNDTSDPSYIEVFFSEQRDIPLFTNDGDPVMQNSVQVQTPDVLCQFTLRKSITSASDLLANSIITRYSSCGPTIYLSTENPPLEDVEYHWRVINMQTNAINFYEGTEVFIPVSTTSGASGIFYIELTIQNEICPDNDGVSDFKIVSWSCNGNGYRVSVQPNPASNAISINVNKDDKPENIGNEKGIIIRRIDGNMAPRRLNIPANGQSINVSDLPNGVYSIEVLDLDTDEPVTTNFIIQR